MRIGYVILCVEAVSVPFFASVVPGFSRRQHFEHVPLFLYENEDVGRRYYLENRWCPEARGKHMAIDTAADLERARVMVEQVPGSHLNYDLPEWHRLMVGV